jgi:hypothetical protein
MDRLRSLFDATRPVIAHPAFAAAVIVLVIAGFLLLFKDFGLMKKPAGTTEEDKNLIVLPQPSPPEKAPAVESPLQAQRPADESLGKSEREKRKRSRRRRAPRRTRSRTRKRRRRARRAGRRS